MRNQALDSLSFDKLLLPYNRIESELSPEPRIVRGLNMAVTRGGKLIKRPGVVEVAATSPPGLNWSSKRIDRLWIYLTQESPQKLYFLASMYDQASGTWGMYYNRPAVSTGWVALVGIRSVDSSRFPHEVVFSRGLAFIKSFPLPTSPDKYGTSVFDGSGASPSLKPWGLPGPTVPAAVYGFIGTLANDVTPTATTITVSNLVSNMGAVPPPTPFYIQVNFESMKVTSTASHPTWTVQRAQRGTSASSHSSKTIFIHQEFPDSANLVDVQLGWSYAYAYKSSTGQVSNRSAAQLDPTQMPSNTGPFVDYIPKIVVQGHPDVSNVPTIQIYRTTDSGGVYFFLRSVPNTGSGNIIVQDNPGSNPTFDEALDQGNIAPSLVSNSPPPTVLAPKVMGQDVPDRSTRIAIFQGRLWYAVGNVLFFSSQEELVEGIPEECWPSGLRGNYYRLNQTITNVIETTEALYVFTNNETYRLSGSNRETFNLSLVFTNLGMPEGQTRAAVSFDDTVAFLTHDYRIAMIRQNKVDSISDPIYTDLVDAARNGATFELLYWADMEKRYLVVCAHRPDDPTQSRQWVFDFNLSEETRQFFWFTPWSIPSVSAAVGRISESASQNRLIFVTGTGQSYALTRLDPTWRTGTDFTPSGEQPIPFYFDTSLFLIPPGNHVNALRRPGLTPVVYAVTLERTLFPGDEDPDVFYYKDDFWTTPIAGVLMEPPARRGLSKSYKTIVVPIHEVAYRFGVRISKPANSQLFELQSLVISWNPEGGA